MAPAGSTLLGAYSLLTAWFFYAAGSAWRRLAGRPRRLGPIDRSRVRSIAFIRLDEMGDFVLFSAILRPLRQAFPDAHIALVLCDWICPLAAGCPYVDEVLPFPSGGPRWRQYLLGPLRALGMALKLRRRFDLIINPRSDRDIRGAAFLAHFSLAPWVVGYPSSTEPFKLRVNRGYDRFYTHLLPSPVKVSHELERSRAILEFLGVPDDGRAPEIWLSADDRRHAEGLLRQDGWRNGDTLICLGISASYARKRWPMEFYMQLAQRLKSMPDSRFVVVGGKADRGTAELLRPVLGSRLFNLAGRASPRVSAAALDQCCLYVGNDSGPKHMAAAMGKPVVEISCHPRDGDRGHFQAPERFGALTDPSMVIAPATALAPCSESCMAGEAHCITQVTVEGVLESAVAILQAQECASSLPHE
jgi:ADP-heptose:LPS heptosyltransferase